MRAPIGIRIRNYRKIMGLSQVNLARAIPISPSYLNLIEANKRDVGGTLLHRIAAELNVDLLDLTGDSETRLINELAEAFANPLLAPLKLEVEDAHVLVAQLPKMAKALHICFRGFLDASASANALSNRLQSDPLFSQLLHQMLSQITAIRSTTEILRDVPGISEQKLQNFHNLVFDESRALSTVTQSLIAQFDLEVEDHHSQSPSREVNDMIIGEDNFFPELEHAAKSIRSNLGLSSHLSEDEINNILKGNGVPPLDPQADAPATIRFKLARRLVKLQCQDLVSKLSKDQRLTTPDAQLIAAQALTSYCAGALLFPYKEFLQAAKSAAYDVEFLAQLYGASFEQIAHRLVTLKDPQNPGIPFGFLRTDPSGFLTKQFPLPGLLMPNAGHACPLWIIYKSLQQPEQVVRQIVSFNDRARYLFIAKTSTKRVKTYNDYPVQTAVMLACNLIHADKTIYANTLNLNHPETDIPVGPTCNLCVRQNCSHRNTPTASPRKT